MIPGGYTDAKLDGDTIIAWYQCKNPKFRCPGENDEYEMIAMMDDSMGSHGGCSGCLMTKIVWRKRAAVIPAIIPGVAVTPENRLVVEPVISGAEPPATGTFSAYVAPYVAPIETAVSAAAETVKKSAVVPIFIIIGILILIYTVLFRKR